MAARVKKGDKVMVLAGRDKGKSGEVLKMLRSENRAIVQGVNMAKRHVRASQTGPGGITEKELPINLSNLAHIDPKDDKPTRVGIRTLDDGRKVRYAKRSGEVIDI
ncbi:MAG: 50S ribosomal protein L24 [Rhodospirillales bacterium]|jgi:large subunit ribosomal protein L24|nr:50S ribosomal protein L24 [Rhodospirillaceae bacterium]MDP6426588.1 50S ribosomal protein L24 [Rhodospirillales bacterium]MDP6645195.1 50S ribosomal protein L24 [Rhodospirillales bacterium]MDP6840374.1 50S ribosomal protein L24 [Rhodospirillales bacterium]|tara:strand:- start:1315 stop:1632 length:318 start_codon:yes stop_codon:yes gene_type:complete